MAQHYCGPTDRIGEVYLYSLMWRRFDGPEAGLWVVLIDSPAFYGVPLGTYVMDDFGSLIPVVVVDRSIGYRQVIEWAHAYVWGETCIPEVPDAKLTHAERAGLQLLRFELGAGHGL